MEVFQSEWQILLLLYYIFNIKNFHVFLRGITTVSLKAALLISKAKTPYITASLELWRQLVVGGGSRGVVLKSEKTSVILLPPLSPQTSPFPPH